MLWCIFLNWCRNGTTKGGSWCRPGFDWSTHGYMIYETHIPHAWCELGEVWVIVGAIVYQFPRKTGCRGGERMLALSSWPPSLGYLGEDLPGSRFYPCGWCFGCYYWPRSRSLGHVGTLGSSSGGSASTTETVECRPCHPWQLDQSPASALVSLEKCSAECAAIDWSASGGCQSCFVCELSGGTRSLNIMAVDHTLIINLCHTRLGWCQRKAQENHGKSAGNLFL